jgi:hypothetical protein
MTSSDALPCRADRIAEMALGSLVRLDVLVAQVVLSREPG